MSTVYSVDVRVTAPVHDTEVTDRVADAVTNIFPTADPSYEGDQIVAACHDMSHVSELLHREEILDTARGVFLDTLDDDAFTFELNKQAAFEGRINFSVGGPAELGDIHVRVRVTEPSAEAFIDAIAPPTEDGAPIDTE
ncbi:RNA-binding domain-containing protein [Halomicrobium sp. LC1Hm]|uniref:RNA-binding domain-containing protein n=1 Tax=Halomicrobium sp. LC1Hm TaxID=2610902 RepID=UPI00129845A5|nr:RNA-binding domain-containing protein [Halomicrobium sp. LC1Hm]QGA81542.1 putative RNA binding protein with dsRBD fold [Halomicrobium sp. LC1Hm]